MVRGKKDCWYTVVLAVSCLNLCSFTALVRRLAGANIGGFAAMGVPPLMILCSIISLAFFLLSSSADQSSLCSISVTLLRLRKLPTTKRAARRCTASNFIMSLTKWGYHTVLAYSKVDLTSELYASSFSLDGQVSAQESQGGIGIFSYFIDMLPPLGIITEQDLQIVVLVYLSELHVTEGVITLHRYSRPGIPHGVAFTGLNFICHKSDQCWSESRSCWMMIWSARAGLYGSIQETVVRE